MSTESWVKRWEFFPSPRSPNTMAMAACDIAVEDLNNCLSVLDLKRDHLHPVQRELLDRFIGVSQDFVRNMRAVNGDPDALRALFGLSVPSETDNEAHA